MLRREQSRLPGKRKETMLNRNMRNTAILLVVFLAVYMFGNYFAEKNLMSGSGSSSYSYERLESDIAKNKVKSIEVVQNAQVPTGSAIVKLNDGEKKVAHVTDVNKVIDLAQQYKVSCQVDDVKSSDAGWLSMILPWIVIGVIMMFMFGMISRASGGGGGIYISGNAQVVMNDGKIVGNTVNGGQGGGVCTIDGYTDTFPGGPNSPGAWPIEQYAQYYPAAFTMNGGEISGNSAIKGDTEVDAATGGGVYIASNCVTLRGGCIENNYAEQQGGGVYIGRIPYSMRIYNAVITGNSATLLGGGIWACPTGDTEAFVTNGAAIFDNAAEGAGDDVVSVKTAGQDYVLTLADRMLGGGRVDWYADGALADGDDAMGQPAPDASRYDAASEAEPLAQIQNSTEPYALKAVASEEAKALANACGALFIRGNRSERGGGIGSNGGVVMGESDKAYSLTVTKAWADAEEALQTSVTVYLKVGDSVLDAVVLNAENGWTASFTGLPDPSSLADGLAYSVAENPVPAFFEPILSEPSLDEETKTISITLTNRYIPHGDLTVSKIISGSAADAAEAFPFTVVLDDETIEGVYGDMTFAGGVAAFTLRGGETVTAVGLPAGVGYTVTETDSGGYEAEARGATGVIADGQTAQAVFSNHKDKPAESEPSDDTSVPEPSDVSDSSSVSSEAPGVSESSDASSTPSTGDARTTGVYTALLLLCGCAAVLTVRRKGRGE